MDSVALVINMASTSIIQNHYHSERNVNNMKFTETVKYGVHFPMGMPSVQAIEGNRSTAVSMQHTLEDTLFQPIPINGGRA